MLTNNAQIPYNSSPKGVDYMKGSVYYDKKAKRHYVQIYWDGRRYRMWRHPITGEPYWDKRSAEKQLDKIRTEVDEGYFNPKHWLQGNPLLVKAYATEWLTKIEISTNTIRGYKSAIVNYIIPFLGDKDIRKVRYNDISDFHRWIPLSDKGKYNVVNVLKAMLRYAWRSEEIQRVPPFPKLSYQEPPVWSLTMEQQELVLSHIPEHDRPIFIFMALLQFRW